MTNNHHEAGGGHEPNGSGIPPHAIFGLDGEVTHLADGTISTSEIVMAHNMGPDEIKEAATELYDLDPDSVRVTPLDGPHVDSEEGRTARRRGSVAFSSSRWHSSWNPGGDPSMN
jgi:hypothetical protein